MAENNMGYFELREFLIRKGVSKVLVDAFTKKVREDYGMLPKDFKIAKHITPDTLLTNSCKTDRLLIAQDKGDYYFFPKICKECQEEQQIRFFTSTKEVERFLLDIFAFSIKVQARVKEHLGHDYDGTFGVPEIPFESFKQDLLNRFSEHSYNICKAFYKLNPYVTNDRLSFKLLDTKPIEMSIYEFYLSESKTFLTTEQEQCFLQFLQQERKVFSKARCARAICHKFHGKSNRMQQNLISEYLEQNYGLFSPDDCKSLEMSAFKGEKGIYVNSFELEGQTWHYVPAALRAWVLERLVTIFTKKRILVDEKEALLAKLTPENVQVFNKCAATNADDMARTTLQEQCLEIIASHLNIPIKAKKLENGVRIFERDSGFNPNVFLSKTPHDLGELRLFLNKEMCLFSNDLMPPEVQQHTTALKNMLLRRGENSGLLGWWRHTPSLEEMAARLEKTTQPESTEVDLDDALNSPSPSTQTIRPSHSSSSQKYSPQALKDYLDKHVEGQEEAKKSFCMAMSDHYKRFIGEEGVHKKRNVLLIGPSGCGKTSMTTTLLKHLDIPYGIVDTSHLTPEGYSGLNLSSMFVDLYRNAKENISKAQKGVIFLDEVDKLGMEVGDHHQFKSLVQTEMLKIIEAHSFAFTYTDKEGDKQEITINTSEILFVLAGHFKDLYSNKDTKGLETIGFLKPSVPDRRSAQSNAPKDVSNADLIRCGLIKEFIGRIPMRIVLGEVDKKMLAKKLDKELPTYKKEFSQQGSLLEFSPKAKQMIIEQAIQEETGMRGIDSVLARVMDPFRFDLPKFEGYKCTVVYDEVLGAWRIETTPLGDS
ncbi:hypothetical protein NHP21005_09630 [Helicobacter sp. NHP21005]|uniref:AAA family ATPase n=1 Tax=Helicobacter felistomachi TaxID=3040201 RepID=UPI00257290D6|nr:AAA family ATPase [Helicobacter sp. NHP21005]BEG57275.1 hypothetical protein NHP21005_09630 [Helicobacter sp. NHP21005]